MARDILFILNLSAWVGIAVTVGREPLSASIAFVIINAIPTYLWWSGRKNSGDGK